jgi:glucokinase
METLPTTTRKDPLDYLDRLVERIGRLAHDNKISGIGLGAPGFLSKDRRSIRYNPNTPALVGIDFVNLLSRVNLPVWLEQDPKVCSLSHFFNQILFPKNHLKSA